MWVLIGTHDLGETLCSPELVLIGILRVVEELLSRTRFVTVVVQGILPRSTSKDGYLATTTSSTWEDIQMINEELKLYARYRSRVVYMEIPVSKLLQQHNQQLLLNSTLYENDYFHLSQYGYQLLANEMIKTIDNIRKAGEFEKVDGNS